MPDPLPTHAGPFALGTFRFAAEPFPGLVTGARVRDLSDLVPSVRALVEDWDHWLPRLGDLADGTWHDLADLEVLAPIEPGQILQSGANYRKHVVDLVAAEKESVHGATPEEARADAEQMMDERIRAGVPYVFLGSPRAMCGPYDDIVLPALGEQHDWELELALVVGKSGRNIPADEAMTYVAAYTICNDLTTRDRLYRPDLKAIGTDWFTAKNADTFLPTGPFLVPA
ncbi:MAG: fumarylacetoacetate hydrolase family protein, partial [Streptomyces sp.]|nr:fumarylacetoacetate hydrolase family protein [Streptomyces sp.]